MPCREVLTINLEATQFGIVLVRDAGDYAMVLIARRALAAKMDVDFVLPIFDRTEAVETESLLAYGFIPGSNPVLRLDDVRSKDASMRKLLDRGGCDIPNLIASALHSLAADGCPIPVDNDPAGERAISVSAMLVDGKSETALIGAYYGFLTGRSLILDPSERHVVSLFEDRRVESVVLVADMAAITKSRIRRLVQASQMSWRGTKLGLLTAYSPDALARLVARLITLRAGTITAARDYLLVEDHGGAHHMKMGGERVLCGAMDASLRVNQSFDCSTNCAFSNRVRSNELDANHLLLLGCESISLGGGIIPPEFSLALNAINGKALSVLGSYKHRTGVQLGDVARALLESGHSQGEIALRLNAIGGCRPGEDYSFVLLGDPDIAARPGARISGNAACRWSFERGDGGRGGVLQCHPLTKTIIVEIPLAPAMIDQLQTPWVILDDDVSLETPLRWVIIDLPADQKALLLFAPNSAALPRIRLKLLPREECSNETRLLLTNAAQAISTLAPLGFRSDLVTEVLRDLETCQGRFMLDTGCHDLLTACDRSNSLEQSIAYELQRLQRLILLHQMEDMATRNFWFPHQRICGDVRPINGSPEATCPNCGISLVLWRHASLLESFRPRIVHDCLQCGIVADLPLASPIDLRFGETIAIGEGMLRQDVQIANTSTKSQSGFLLVQFNCWEVLGIAGDPVLQQVSLAPGEQRGTSVDFVFACDHRDDVVTLQAFFLSEGFDVSNILKKMLMPRGDPVTQSGANLARWHWNGTRFVRI